ncbi:hypothetical protein C4569_03835 [Candidatus Parcubacteria bacterium]|nr:MAG: hypothetical protein C4569_03835 [Candidatus Parcubacteria bacterium]
MNYKIIKQPQIYKKILFNVVILAIFGYTNLFPQHYVLARQIISGSDSEMIAANQESAEINHLPENKDKQPRIVKYITITAYSSTPDQTDGDPFTTANGTKVRWGIAAANFLPFYTNIKIPDYFGDQIFLITDRMNKRFPDRIDIWFPTRQEAQKFGLRTLKVEIY